MRNDFLDKTLNTIAELNNSISTKYNSHIKIKAIRKVNEQIKVSGLNIDDIEKDDYEIMVYEVITEIKEEYSSKTAKVGLSLLGLDLLLG